VPEEQEQAIDPQQQQKNRHADQRASDPGGLAGKDPDRKSDHIHLKKHLGHNGRTSGQQQQPGHRDQNPVRDSQFHGRFPPFPV